MSLRAANGETIYTYGVYDLKLSYNDSSGSQTESNHRFIVCDFEIPGVTMILGIPWLKAINPDVDWPSQI
jgi:hypothetical protein